MPVSVCEGGEHGYDTCSLRLKAAEPARLTMPAKTQNRRKDAQRLRERIGQSHAAS
jgi:hypothetical protein